MDIKDKEGQLRIKLSDFEKQYGDSEPVFVDLIVEVTTNNAMAKEAITIELSDFEVFLKNLKRLDETLTHSFYFHHIDEQLQIRFEPLSTGNITVTGFLKDKRYMNVLNFSFEMPATELCHLIRQMKDIIDVIAYQR